MLSQTPDLRVDDDLDMLGAEKKQAGRLSWRVYQTYWAAVGGVLAAAILMSLLLMQGLDLCTLMSRSRRWFKVLLSCQKIFIYSLLQHNRHKKNTFLVSN